MNLLHGLAGMFSQDAVENFASLDDLVGLNFDVGNLPADAAVRLMDHDLGVLEREPLSFFATCQEHRTATCREAYAIGRHGAGNHLHGVVDRERRGHAAARRIDIKVNILAAIFALQVQELHHQFVGVAVVNLALQEDDAVFE